jgi:hypothetical protein
VILQLGQPETSATKTQPRAHSAPRFGEKQLILYIILAAKKPKSIADIAVRIISVYTNHAPMFHLTNSISRKK